MAQAERDLGTNLDWLGVEHWNTNNPHIHVIVRGKSDDGGDLVMSCSPAPTELNGVWEEHGVRSLGGLTLLCGHVRECARPDRQPPGQLL